eukprot:c15638_g1_i1 orf=113-364(+)
MISEQKLEDSSCFRNEWTLQSASLRTCLQTKRHIHLLGRKTENQAPHKHKEEQNFCRQKRLILPLDALACCSSLRVRCQPASR